VDPLIQLAIYQVGREAVLNAAQHAGADEIRLRLFKDEDQIRLSVEDDGTGFSPSEEHGPHFGLMIMRERTESVGGVIYVDSAPGEGTLVAARFPTQLGSAEDRA
jgi:signal transduction histidine kinase